MQPPLHTIGHSNHSLERFLELLKSHEIQSICDVRSHPYSQYCPHFNREALEFALKRLGIQYEYLGKELGGRTDDVRRQEAGKVVYSRLAKTELFQTGLHRLKNSMLEKRVALMCAEKDPLTCHRTILICRQLREEAQRISHILEDGETESQNEAEARLMKTLKIESPNLFYSDEELIEQAYDRQGEAIAYVVGR